MKGKSVIICVFMAVLAAVLCTRCEKPRFPYFYIIHGDDTLSTKNDTLLFSSGLYDSLTIYISANVAWWRNAQPDWIELDPSLGETGDSVVVRASANPKDKERSGSIILTTETFRHEFTVLQGGNPNPEPEESEEQ